MILPCMNVKGIEYKIYRLIYAETGMKKFNQKLNDAGNTTTGIGRLFLGVGGLILTPKHI